MKKKFEKDSYEIMYWLNYTRMMRQRHWKWCIRTRWFGMADFGFMSYQLTKAHSRIHWKPWGKHGSFFFNIDRGMHKSAVGVEVCNGHVSIDSVESHYTVGDKFNNLYKPEDLEWDMVKLVYPDLVESLRMAAIELKCLNAFVKHEYQRVGGFGDIVPISREHLLECREHAARKSLDGYREW